MYNRKSSDHPPKRIAHVSRLVVGKKENIFVDIFMGILGLVLVGGFFYSLYLVAIFIWQNASAVGMFFIGIFIIFGLIKILKKGKL